MNEVILTNKVPGTPVSISIYTAYQEKPHYHDGFLEIIYCFKGQGIIHVSYEDIILEEGDIISCDPHDIHCLQSEGDSLFISFYFDLTDPIFENANLPHLFFVTERYVLRKEKQNELQNLKHQLLTLLYFYCFPHPKISQQQTFCTLSKKIIDHMLQHFHFFDYASNLSDCSNEIKSRFERLLVFTKQHYQEKLTIERLSKEEHLNSNYFSHTIKSSVFMGYSQLLHFMRVYESERLLLDTQKNISEISYEVGYSDPKFYYRNFKKWYGHTPLQHRNQFKETECKSKENTYYKVAEIATSLEHFIAYYYATLHIPDFWNVPYIPYRNVPFK